MNDNIELSELNTSLHKAENIDNVKINAFDKETGSPLWLDGNEITTKEDISNLMNLTDNTQYIGRSLIPTTTEFYNIGAASRLWNNIYAKQLRIKELVGINESNSITYYASEIANKEYVDNKVNDLEDSIRDVIPDVSEIYNEVDRKIKVNSDLIEELASQIVDIYKVPDKWVEQFSGITYSDCIEFVGEWRKGSFFQHNNDVFTGVNILVDTETQYIFSYGFITTKNDKLFIYIVQVSCTFLQNTGEWAVNVNPTYETYLTQDDYDNILKKIEDVEESIKLLPKWNLINNSGFINSTDGWSINGGSTISVHDDTNSPTGYILRTDIDGYNKGVAYTDVHKGNRYSFSVYMKSNVNGSVVYTSVSNQVPITLTTSWQKYEITYTPTGTYGRHLYIVGTPTNNSNSYVDIHSPMLVEGAVPAEWNISRGDIINNLKHTYNNTRTIL